MRHAYLAPKQRQPRRARGATMLMLSGALTSPSHCEEAAPCDSHGAALPPPVIALSLPPLRNRILSGSVKVCAVMDETDIMDLTHQKARKRPRPISSADESVHASLKRLPIRAAEYRETSLMFAVRGEPLPAASLKQNDHSVTSSPNTVMPAQVKVRRGGKK